MNLLHLLTFKESIEQASKTIFYNDNYFYVKTYEKLAINAFFGSH